jgi:tetratricopeptide (TPR) repeat protein
MNSRMQTAEDHFDLIRHGLLFHEDRKYSHALSLFERALELAPRCPSATYNQANTLNMLGRYEESRSILLKFVNTSEAEHLSGCLDMAETPRSLCLDAFNLLFLSTLHATESWRLATPFLREHLRRRTRGLQSLWSRRQIIRDADELRKEYAPKAQPVRDWVL